MIALALSVITNFTFQTVAVGTALLGITSGVLGCFAVQQKQSLLGEGVSHATLPGVVAAFLITGAQHTEVLLAGALLSGITAALIIRGIISGSRVKFDAALALVYASFFGIGLVLLTYAQKLPAAGQAGLEHFIFGQASAMLTRDVIIMGVGSVILLGAIALFWKELVVTIFDPVFAQALGVPVARLSFTMMFLLVIVIVLGLQSVGAVLMSSMLVAPAVAARQWCNRFSSMVVVAGVFGAISGISGTFLSSMLPGIPTGPAIVVCICAIALVSLLIAPGRGIISRARSRQALARRLIKEPFEIEAS